MRVTTYYHYVKKITSISVLVFTFFAFFLTPVFADTTLTWESLPNMPIGRYGHSAVAIGDKIYLIGGIERNGLGYIGPVSEYSVSTETWIQKSQIPTKRDSAGVALGPDGRIYVVGGYGTGSSQVLNSLEIYDPVTDTWTIGAPMPTPRSDLAAVFGTNGKLYAIGGFSFSAPDPNLGLDIVEEYDPSGNTWTTKSSLIYARYGLGAALGSDGLIYIAGGAPQRAVETYDINNDAWTLKTPPFNSHVHGNLIAATNGMFYLIGDSTQVEEYNPFINTWTLLQDLMPTPGGRFGVVQAIGGLLYRFGGQSDNTDVSQYVIEKATIHSDGEPTEATFNASSDTYIRNGQANQNEGGGQFMQLRGSGNNRALVRFDQGALQTAIGSSTVLSAKLRLTITNNGNNWGTTGRTIDVHRLISDWTEGNGTENDRGTGSGATWNCAVDNLIQNQAKDCTGTTEWEMGHPNNSPIHPWVETASTTQTITSNQTGVVEFDVTNDVATFLEGANNFGWIIKKTNEGAPGQVSFGTRESLFIPQLVITYQP